jgi:hypothetical protein
MPCHNTPASSLPDWLRLEASPTGLRADRQGLAIGSLAAYAVPARRCDEMAAAFSMRRTCAYSRASKDVRADCAPNRNRGRRSPHVGLRRRRRRSPAGEASAKKGESQLVISQLPPRSPRAISVLSTGGRNAISLSSSPPRTRLYVLAGGINRW